MAKDRCQCCELATSTYDVPEALLGIGLDRVILDRTQP